MQNPTGRDADWFAGSKIGAWTITRYAGEGSWDAVCKCGEERAVRRVPQIVGRQATQKNVVTCGCTTCAECGGHISPLGVAEFNRVCRLQKRGVFFCSKVCKTNYLSKGICETCGGSLRGKPRNKFCSVKCDGIMKSKMMTGVMINSKRSIIPCDNCGKELSRTNGTSRLRARDGYTRAYCSQACYREHQHSLAKKCVECGQNAKSGSSYCASCGSESDVAMAVLDSLRAEYGDSAAAAAMKCAVGMHGKTSVDPLLMKINACASALTLRERRLSARVTRREFTRHTKQRQYRSHENAASAAARELRCRDKYHKRDALEKTMEGLVSNLRKRTGKKTVAKAKELLEMFHLQKGMCALTGMPLFCGGDTFHADHIIPLSRGGTSEIVNLQLVTKTVNRAKGSLTNDEFFAICEAVVLHRASTGGGSHE